MYEKLNYFDQYGGSLILFIVITIVVIILISYFHTMINIQPIIDDWPNQRCKLNIIPIAGLITHPEGISASEYTSQNFTYCTQNILSGITGVSVQPLTYITNALKSLANVIQRSIQSIRAMFDKVRSSMQSVSEEIMGRLINVMVPLQQIIIGFKDLLGKIQGTMTASLFTVLGSYYTLKSLMGAIAQFIIMILIAIAAMVAAFWAVPFTWGAAVANTAIFVAIAIPMSIILAFMVDTLNIRGYKIPKIKCFDKNTLLTMNDGSLKKIIEVEPGDILSNNNKVTAKIKVITENSEIYLLDNIIVSDSHIVKYGDKWIPVSKHPYAVKINNLYFEPYLYCLNTSNKIIEINNHVFTDWDEIYDESLDEILNNHLIPIKKSSDIHKYLDYGFDKSTKIKLRNNDFVNIDRLVINDILENGEKVYGIVEINSTDISQTYSYNLGVNTYIEGYMPILNVEKRIIDNNDNSKLYNILTDRGTFKINGVIMNDYNFAIDRFLTTK